METALVLAALWLAFGASHIALSSLRWRPRLTGVLGEGAFLGLYSLLSLALFVPLVTIYFRNKHAGPLLWSLGGLPGLRWLVYLGMGLAFALAVAGLASPSPASIAPGEARVRGVFRVTRHPLLMGVALFGALHLAVATVNAAELAFFAGFPLFILAGCRHQDQRKLANGDAAFQRFHRETAFLPRLHPAALGQAIREQPLPLALGAGLAALLRWFHPALFGPG